ncbi:hypothetical protein C8R46DRAFT_1340744 [Mycena filopes]|nr:hypothetical protein C8R46DRAFT_1340744 [Mycena filopes]
MPRLRHLDLILEDDDPGSATVVFIEAPLLRTVLINFAPARVVLPWAQLTSLPLRSVFPEDCSPILEQTRNLIFCHLFLLSDDDGILNANPDIILRSLTSLKLEADPIADWDYLHTFTLPSLRCLDITEKSLGPNPLQCLASFISTSGCNLQELIMRQKHGIPRRAYCEAFPSVDCSFFGDGEESESTDTEGESSDEESSSESE